MSSHKHFLKLRHVDMYLPPVLGIEKRSYLTVGPVAVITGYLENMFL
jgi:hypothetical protein